MNRTSIDWWAFRAKGSPEEHQWALSGVFEGSGYPVRLRPRKGGFLGYKGSADVVLGDMDVGVHAWGGENQRGWSLTSLSGAGCGWVQDWAGAQDAAGSVQGYEVKRVDIALDRYDGSVGFQQTLEAYRAGGFSPAGSGRPPKCEPMDPERDEDSAIIRIGSRQSDKYLRGYEKGKQLLGPAIAKAMRKDPESFEWHQLLQERQHRVVDGEAVMVPLWNWWRLELELKAQSAELPEDIIDRRDQYFAGAYPYLGQVLGEVEAEPLIMLRERAPQMELRKALATLRAQYGSTLFTALVAHGGDILAVWDQIVGSKHNDALLKAGVCMVDHT